ncbi:Y-family DNA polymerase [uncultured Tenacibaculum sp.]|uniref:Y-family DNA polymerase n=1 Tax=uncultured Tenacibaculum sp. TaxID=174713 RepID=UPI00260BC250|nr:Y-family DNA polymerase [uncultured Tenacibaculum sp.]
MFALVDCNNFYASCERLFRPDLNGKPVVVLSNNDGCVIARSSEAKKLGIPMGAPAYQFKQVFKENNVNVFSSNFPLYGDLSQRVMNILQLYTPDIEIYSIDEAFLEFKGFDKHFSIREHCLEMKAKVQQWTSIPISIGLAPTKALSKIATRVAKKYPTQTKGVHVIDTEEKRIKALKWVAIEDVWGIGRRYAKRLRALNVNTAYDFTQLHPQWVKKNMTIVGLRLHRDLCGLPTLKLDDPIVSKKNIATTRSFAKDLESFDEIRERISTFAVKNAEKLRKQNSECSYVIVFIATNTHKNPDKQYSRSVVMTLPYSTNINNDLNVYAIAGLKKIFRKGYQYKRGGVIVGNIRPMGTKQLTLFDAQRANMQPLMSAIDKLNTKYRKDYIKLATQDPSRNWKMRQERLSPNYTTKMSDVLIVK